MELRTFVRRYLRSFYFSVFNQIYDPNHALSDCLQLYKSDIAAHGWERSVAKPQTPISHEYVTTVTNAFAIEFEVY